jgi:glycerol-3-phosphate acyltransferase PlsY
MLLIAAMIGAYFFGSMPTAVLVARRVAGINILEVGSGNPGASNIFRTLGPRWAITTFAVDVFKGYMPVWLVSKFAHDLIIPEFAPNATTVMAWVGMSAFLGHVRSPFLHFRGGKGASTGLGAMFAMAPQATTLAILVYAAALFATRTFSLATLTAAVAYPVLLFLREGNGDWHVLGWGLAIPLLLMVTHRRNIARVFSGKELRMRTNVDHSTEEDHEEVE